MKANENQSAARKALLLRGWEALCQPLVAIIFGLVVGAVVILACGQNPMAVYAELFEKSFIKPYYLFSTLTRATPIIICAMATGMSWRAGYINLGVEGQMVTGTLVATVVALFLPGPPLLVAVIAWIAGMAAGALYALLPSVLVWKFNVSMVITTLMLKLFCDLPPEGYLRRWTGPSDPGGGRPDAPAPADLHLYLQRGLHRGGAGGGVHGVHHPPHRVRL